MYTVIQLLIFFFLTYLITYLLTPWRKVLLVKLIGFQPAKKYPTFNGTRMFITSFTSVRNLLQLNPVHTLTSHFLKIHLNVLTHVKYSCVFVPIECLSF